MPETSIDEHGDLGGAEQQVGSSAWHPWERMVDPIPKSSSMEKPSNGQLRRCVAPPRLGHASRDRGATRCRSALDVVRMLHGASSYKWVAGREVAGQHTSRWLVRALGWGTPSAEGYGILV